jgi:hypothetical protein
MKWRRHVPRAYSVLEPLVTAKFWSKVDIPEARGFRDTCWNWRQAKDRHGYGQFKPMSYVPPLRSHRVAWELVNGPVPEGQLILHSCDNRACCNPAHLRPGSHQENMDDKKRARQVREQAKEWMKIEWE